MTGQQQIADRGTPATTGPCSWCGETTGLRLTLRPARWRNDRGVRVMAKPAHEVWCCSTHQRSLELRGDDA